MDTFIGVAAHKEYRMPEGDIYHPIQVGSALHNQIKGYFHDNEGENISKKNLNYSELTAVFYLWKSIKADAKGIVHYRRLLATKSGHNKVLGQAEIDSIISSGKIILPKRRNYVIETNYSHYAHAHNIEDLDETRKIIIEKYPDYTQYVDKVFNRTSAHMFNMFIMGRAEFDAYSVWLFDVLFELEKKIDISGYSVQEARVFGYISELLLDVWVEKNHIPFVERPVIYLEGQHLLRKATSFMQRKIFGQGDTHITSKID